MARVDHAIPVALTLDVDPDANRAVAGRTECVSAGFNARITLGAVREGLYALHRLLCSLRLPATVFWEARTLNALAKTDPNLIAEICATPLIEHGCHGLRHEDLTAHLTKCPIPPEDKKRRIETATDMITRMAGTRPVGFRAPYCRVDSATLGILAELSYAYDASMSVDAFAEPCADGQGLHPGAGIPEGLREVPLLLWRDATGQPISGYLWQLLEGRRSPGEYVDMVRGIGGKHPGRLIQLAIHPWHLAAGEDGEPVEDILPGIDAVNALLHVLKSDPRVRWTTVLGAVRGRCGEYQSPP